MSSIGTELGQIGADIIAQVRTADTARIAEMEKALRKMRDRVEYASNQFHNSTHWHSEPSPDNPDVSLWDWVLSPATTALGGQS